jgi:hypothetical protein
MVPTVALPPATPFTLQFTGVPGPLALNVCDCCKATLAADGLTITATGAGVGVGLGEGTGVGVGVGNRFVTGPLPPPHAVNPTRAQRASRIAGKQIVCCGRSVFLIFPDFFVLLMDFFPSTPGEWLRYLPRPGDGSGVTLKIEMDIPAAFAAGI